MVIRFQVKNWNKYDLPSWDGILKVTCLRVNIQGVKAIDFIGHRPAGHHFV
jgi:hypothetical protein